MRWWRAWGGGRTAASGKWGGNGQPNSCLQRHGRRPEAAKRSTFNFQRSTFKGLRGNAKVLGALHGVSALNYRILIRAALGDWIRSFLAAGYLLFAELLIFLFPRYVRTSLLSDDAPGVARSNFRHGRHVSCFRSITGPGRISRSARHADRRASDDARRVDAKARAGVAGAFPALRIWVSDPPAPAKVEAKVVREDPGGLWRARRRSGKSRSPGACRTCKSIFCSYFPITETSRSGISRTKFRRQSRVGHRPAGPGPDRPGAEAKRGKEVDVWNIEQTVDRGYAMASFYCGDVVVDEAGAAHGAAKCFRPVRAG